MIHRDPEDLRDLMVCRWSISGSLGHDPWRTLDTPQIPCLRPLLEGYRLGMVDSDRDETPRGACNAHRRPSLYTVRACAAYAIQRVPEGSRGSHGLQMVHIRVPGS